MDRLETLVRETLVERASDAPPGADLLAAVTTRPSRGRWYAVGAAAVVVLVIGLAVALWPDRATREQTSIPPPPAGYRWQSFHGLSVAVPARLPTTHSDCMPPRNVVLVPDGDQNLCPYDAHPNPPGTVIILSRGDAARSSIAKAATTVNGLAGRLGVGKVRWSNDYVLQTGVFVLPRRNIVVEVTAPSRSTIDTVLASVRATPVDALGCAGEQATIVPTDNAPASELVPGTPTSAIRCSYSALLDRKTFWLVGSARVPTGTLQNLVYTIDSLPTVSPTSEPATFASTAEQLIFTYADGHTRTIVYGYDERFRADDGQLSPVATDGHESCNDVGHLVYARLG